MTGQAKFADELATFGSISRRNLIFREDRFVRAFRNAGAAVYAGIWIDVIPGPFSNRFSGDDALYRANFHTTPISQTKTGNNMCHGLFLLEI
jgi:hypothetical protein